MKDSLILTVRIFATSINKQIALSGLFTVYHFIIDEVVQADNSYFLSTYDFRKNELYIVWFRFSCAE